MAFNQGCRGIVPGVGLNVGFLYYFLLANRQKLNDLGTGTTFKELSATNLKTFQLPLPPLDEQKRIVAVLDQAFAALDRARAQVEFTLNDCETLFEDVRNSIIADASEKGQVAKLSDVASINSKLVDPQSPDLVDLPHLGAGNMLSGTDQLIDVKSAREEGLKSGKYVFNAQTVLYSKIRPYLRKVARPDFSGLCSADVYPLSTSSMLERDFLFHLLLSSHFTTYVIAGPDRAGMPKVNRKHLFDFEFQLPSNKAQREAARRIDAVLAWISQVKERTKTNLSNISELRESLLQKAFAGELG